VKPITEIGAVVVGAGFIGVVVCEAVARSAQEGRWVEVQRRAVIQSGAR
jgi:hypothetical protein